MGTTKRERQKANRQLKLQEMAREARRDKSKKMFGRVVLVIVIVLAITGGIWLLGGGNDSASTDTTTTAAVIDTTMPGATTVPVTKPSVEIPAEIPTELVITDLVEGTGDAAKAGDSITVHYVGVLSADGTEFDNSYDGGQPFTLTLGAGMVIDGWDQGLVGAKVGGRRQLDIPAELAYGDVEKSGIPANSALTFVVDIVAITPAG